MIRPVLALTARTLRNTGRRPQFAAPLVIFPSLFLAVNVGGLSRSTELPGFPPVAGFLDFQLAGAMTQSLLLGGVATGISVALEMEGGFFDRLVVAPIPRTAIVFGRLAAAGVIAVGQVLWFIALGLIFGAHIVGGVPGVLLMLLIGAIAGTGFGAIGVMIALRARNASTVQGIFPLVFVVLFVSSAWFPQGLLQSPADTIAEYNPLSYVAAGLREPVISGVTASAALEGIGAALGIAVVMTVLCVLSLRSRLREP
jgi:ABC-2 type transport system permease protein